jgi:hypothetical protein
LADWLLLYTWFGLSLPEDPWEKLLALLAIIIVWPLVLGGHALTNAEMNGRFVLASRVSPPQGRTVMVRSGGLVFAAALRRSGWALISGSGETSIPNPPEEWWLDDALAKEMGLDIDTIKAERRTLII